MTVANLPCDRACGRRGHAHALGAAQGPARHRRALAARPCPRRDCGGRRHGDGRRRRPGAGGGRRGGEAHSAGRHMLRATRAPRNGARGAGGESGDRTATRRYSHCLWRHAAYPAGDADAAAGAAGRGRRRRRAGIPAGRSGRLRPARRCRKQARRHPRRGRRRAPSERAIGLCNGGIMALAGEHALAILERIGDRQSQGANSI